MAGSIGIPRTRTAFGTVGTARTANLRLCVWEESAVLYSLTAAQIWQVGLREQSGMSEIFQYWNNSGADVTFSPGANVTLQGPLTIPDNTIANMRFFADDNTAAIWMVDLIVWSGDSLVLEKTSSVGIKVDTDTPTYPWHDLLGEIRPKATGAGSPARAAYAGGNVGLYAFALNDVCDFDFHIPHDYVPGTDLYFHVHWSHSDAVSITGTVTYTIYFNYAKGHNQANFAAELTSSISYATVDLATTPQYRHRIDEIAITAATADASHLDRDDLEPDGLMHITLKVTAMPTFGGAGKLFLHFCDLHYQSTCIGTKQKAPDFYT